MLFEAMSFARRAVPRSFAPAMAVGLVLLLGASSAAAQDDGHGHGAPPGVKPGGRPPVMQARPGPGRQPPPAMSGIKRIGDGHGDAHGEANGADEEHALPPINWVYGLLGEKEGAPPSLAYRPKGMATPFLALLVNFGLLLGLGLRFGKKPVVDGLKDRKKRIMRDIDEAAKTKAAAKKRFNQYKKKLEGIDTEVTRIRGEYAAQAELDKARIIEEAETRRVRMTKDAEFVLAQERKQLSQELLHETVSRATRSAEELLRQRLGASDQDRLAEDFLGQLGASLEPSRAISSAATRPASGGAA